VAFSQLTDSDLRVFIFSPRAECQLCSFCQLPSLAPVFHDICPLYFISRIEDMHAAAVLCVRKQNVEV